MWRIVVLIEGDREWSSIWTASGPGAGADAATRFAAIRAMFSGEWDDEPNAHSYAWVAARLMRGAHIVEECDRTESRPSYDTVPSPPDDE